MTGVCPICGPVTITPYGRGYVCVNTTAAKRRTVQQEAPAPRCRICSRWGSAKHPLNDLLECPSCSANMQLQRDAVAGEHPSTWAGYRDPSVELDDGFHVVDGDNPYFDDRQEAVPAWRTLGSERPWNEA